MRKNNLDPRTKLIISFCLSLLAITFQDWIQLLVLFLFLLFFSWVMGVDFRKAWGGLRVLLPLLLLLLIVQSVFSSGGKVLLKISSLPILTTSGLIIGLSIMLRMAVLLLSALFLLTGRPGDLILGLIYFKVPYEIAFMVSLGFSFIPLFQEEVKDTIIALQLRGREIKKAAIGENLKLAAAMFFPLVYGVLVKAEKMTVTMETRGFRAFKTRTYYKNLTMKYIDYFLMTLFIIATMIIIILNWL